MHDLHESCGIFGIYAPGVDVARVTFFALYALQHRGQESAGIATAEGDSIHIYTDMGLVAHVFNEEQLARHCESLLRACRSRTGSVIFVANEVGMGDGWAVSGAGSTREWPHLSQNLLP